VMWLPSGSDSILVNNIYARGKSNKTIFYRIKAVRFLLCV